MGKSENQKLKIVYLMKIFLEKTDESNSITMAEIISSLKAYDITAERKSIYSDIECLRQYGLDIIGEQQDKTFYYRVVNRQFELAELKLLVDSVQSSKFITAKKSNELIQKILGLASKHEASRLHRHVYVSERVKTMNENIYYNVDQIHSAISENSKIRFQYFQWNVQKKMELRRNGKFYEVSPWALLLDNENYYLVAFDSDSSKIKHFRVDKMLNIEIDHVKREGRRFFKNSDTGSYAKKRFSMYDGKLETIKLECENYLAGVIIDRFGKEVMIVPKDQEHFVANVNVAVSKQFFAWVMSLGEGIRIVGPDSVLEQIRAEIDRLHRQYHIAEVVNGKHSL